MHRTPPASQRGASLVLATLALTLCLPGLAQEGPALPLWELGAVGVAVSQQAYPGSLERVQQALALPFFIYRGEFLRVDRGSAGIRALKTPALELDVGVSGALGSRASDVAARRGMADLGTLVEFGPRLRWNISPAAGPDQWRADLPLRGVFDLSSSLAQRGVSFEPELTFSHRDRDGWSYSTGVSAIWGDQRLAELYYSVSAAEATASRAAYAAQGGLIALRLSGSVSRRLTPDLRLFLFGRVDSVSGAANQASPLVQQSSGASAGLVLSYTWKQSESRAAD